MNTSITERVAYALWQADRKQPEHRVPIGGGLLHWQPKPWAELTDDERQPYINGATSVISTFPLLADA